MAPSREGLDLSGSVMRNVLVNLGLALVSLLLALGAAEIATRLVAPQQLIVHRPDIYTPAPVLGARHRPGVRTTINTGERTVAFLTDERGYRVGPTPRPDAPHRVLLLGDSFMEALAVPYEQTLAGLLEARLPRDLGHPVVVRNTGVSGYDPKQYLEVEREALARESYDAVVVSVFPANDVMFKAPAAVATAEPTEAPRSSRASRAYRTVAKPVNDFLRSRSHLFNLAKNAVEAQLVRSGLLVRPRYADELFTPDARVSPAWEEAADLCARIAREAQARGTPTLFVVIPLALEVDPVLLRSYATANGLDPASLRTDKSNPLMTRLLRERGLTVVDAQPALRAAQASGSLVYGRVDPHLSPAGHAVLAGLLEPMVARMLRQPASPAGSGAR